MLSKDFPETYTQAYQSGVICAMIHNAYPDEDLPTFIQCALKFYALRELFGERMWQKIKVRANFRERVALYESMEYQPGRPRPLMGNAEDFALGYVKSYENSKRKHNWDKVLLGVLNNNV
jgi:hypothetical protein